MKVLLGSGFALIVGVMIMLVHPTNSEPDSNLVAGTPIEGVSTVHKAWYGGFIGEFDVELDTPAAAWTAVLKFRRKVFGLRVSNADIKNVNQKRIFHLESRCYNQTLEAGDKVHGFFYADTWKEVKGFKGKIKVTPHIPVRL